MKPRIIPICLCLLWLFCLSGGAIFAQEEAVAQADGSEPLLFEGVLENGSDSDTGNHTITYHVAFNAGDRVTITALCEMAADGLRALDPALTVFAPEIEGQAERQQWYNDDSDEVTDCVEYRSSRVSFEAPFSGDYQIIIENLAADRAGPFSLSVAGSTAEQILAPAGGDESTLVDADGGDEVALEVEDGGEVVAVSDEAIGDDESSVLKEIEVEIPESLTYSGILAAKDDPARAAATYEITLNAGDEISAELTCVENYEARTVDPMLTISYTDADLNVLSWENDDHDEAVACQAYRSSLIQFTAPEDGVYEFEARNLSYYKGGYTLSVLGASAAQPQDLQPQSALWDGVSEVHVLDRFRGTLEVKGEEIHSAQLTEGEEIALLASCEPDANEVRAIDPLIRVIDPAGELVLTVDDSEAYQECATWFSAYAEFEAASSGEYQFIVRNVADGVGGPYSLTLVQPGVELAAAAAAVPVPGVPSSDGFGASGEDKRLGLLGEIGSVFRVNMGDGPRIDIYAVNEQSVGQHVLSVYSHQLNAAPASETLIGSSGRYRAFLRPDGNLRISAGPNSQGKTYNMVISGIDGGVISTYDEFGASAASAAAAPAAASSAPAPAFIAVHTVQAGENLYRIGLKYGVSAQAVADANGLDVEGFIHIGQQLNIPAP